LLDIYRTAEAGATPRKPGETWSDIDRLELSLNTFLGLSLPGLWDRDRTLGTIFEHTGRSAAPSE
jgi:hypothetical protein